MPDLKKLISLTALQAALPSWLKSPTKPSYNADEISTSSTTNKFVTSAEKSTWNSKGTYSKPSGGIPKSDLASTVQTSLGKADTALQSFTETDPTVPSWAKQSSKPSYTASEVGAIATSAKGAASGVAELDANGKVPSSQLPSYVDDVLEFSAKSSFPTTGETGKIYVDTSNNKTYRWSGSDYVEISASLALGTTSSTAYRGDRGKTAYDHSQKTSGNPHNVTAADVGLGNVGNFKAVSTVASQGLSDTEKSNARANIGAGTSSLSLGTSSSTAYRGDRGNTAYSHATDSSRLTTATSSGLYKVASTAQGHIASLTPVEKADITALGIPAQDTTYSAATTSAAGLMSADDKTKLNGIASGAQVNSITGVKGNAESSYRTGNVNITPANIGLGNVGDFKAVSTVASQGLSDTEKSNARANIGAGTSSLALGTSSTQAAAGNHTHGNITNAGALQTTDVGIANGDKIVVTDASNSNKVARTSASFDGSTTTQVLTKKGTFETFPLAAYGICDTAADVAAKVVTLASDSKFTLVPGSMVAVLSTYTNTAQNPTLDVNGTGAKPIVYGTAVIETTNLAYATYANRQHLFMYDGTNYIYLAHNVDNNTTYSNASLGQGYGTCTTAAATAAKVVTLSNYALATGGIVSVKFSYDVPASATMNVNSKGAKAIYYRGAAITAGVIKAGDTATFIYSTYYHLISIDRDDNTGTVTGVKVGSTSYSPSSGVVSLPAYPTSLPASDVYSWAKQSSKPSYDSDEISDTNRTHKFATQEQLDQIYDLTQLEAEDRAGLVECVDGGAKNLLSIEGATREVNQVTATYNSDGSITTSGTASGGNANFTIRTYTPAEAAKLSGLVLSGCPSGGSTGTWRLILQKNSADYDVYAEDTGNGAVVGTVPSVSCVLILQIKSGYSKNATWYPMLCTKAAFGVSNKFVPYRVPITGLTAVNKSIACSTTETSTGIKFVATKTAMYKITVTAHYGATKPLRLKIKQKVSASASAYPFIVAESTDNSIALTATGIMSLGVGGEFEIFATYSSAGNNNIYMLVEELG